MDRRKKKLRRRRRNRLTAVLLVLMLFFIWLGARNYMNMEGLGLPGSGDGGRLSACLEDLYSPSAALVDAGTGEKLGAAGGSRRIYPASMTKIMTAVVALEHISSLDETITMPGDFYGQLYEENASMADLSRVRRYRTGSFSTERSFPPGRSAAWPLRRKLRAARAALRR